MKRYDTYKDSGVQWIGEIPGHWEIVRQKRVIKLINGKAFKDSEFEENGKYKIVRVGNLFTNPEWYTSSLELSPDKYIEDGDLIYAWSMSYAPLIWHGEKAIYHYHIWKTILSDLIVKEYAFYYFIELTRAIKAEVHSTTMGFITMEVMNKAYIPLPPLPEQESIVNYLDNKLSKIDAYVADKEREIDALEELKQTEIANIVTKGLNTNVPMKNSRINWIGEIPKHWEVVRLGNLFTENKTKNTDLEYNRALKFNFGSLVPKGESGDLTELEETYSGYTKIRKNDIAINGLNLNYDFVSQRVAIARENGILTSAYLIISPRDGVNADYFTYLFKGMDAQKLFHGMGTGIRLTLSYAELKKQALVVPPLPEQYAIVAHIEKKLAQIDLMVSSLRQQIERLTELKQCIISDAVTGKIKIY